MAARKSTTKKKAGAKKKTGAKKAARKKSGAKKEAVKKTAAKKKAAKKTAKKKTAAKTGASSTQVSMGHVFSLRPRVATSFRPDDFRRARQLLASESYPNLPDAARAVADKALELTHEGPSHGGRSKRF